MKKNLLTLPLQFFAEGTGEANGDTGDNTSAPDSPVTFTEAELQAEADRRVTQAQKTWDKQFEVKLAAALKKQGIIKDSKNEQELPADVQAKIDELNLKEKELTTRELMAKTTESLAKSGLDVAWSDTLVLIGDEANINAKIKALKVSVDKLVADKVKEALKTGVPQGDGGTTKSQGQIFAEKANQSSTVVDPWKNNGGK